LKRHIRWFGALLALCLTIPPRGSGGGTVRFEALSAPQTQIW